MRISFSELDLSSLLEEIKNRISAFFQNITDGQVAQTDPQPPESPPESKVDFTIPDLGYLREHFAEAIGSFYQTIGRIMQDNPVDIAKLTELAGKAKSGAIAPDDAELNRLKLAAVRQGRAVGGVCGFFLKYRPYPMLAEIRQKEKLFQPPFGPIMVVNHDTVLDVLSRHSEFTVDPYGREMVKSMTPEYNGGLDTFILSTDDDSKYINDKRLLTTVVNAGDGENITDLIHRDSMRRLNIELDKARTNGDCVIDVVPALARFVPVTLAQHYLGVPVAKQNSSFELNDDMLKYYGEKVAGPDGQTALPLRLEKPDGNVVDLPDTALKRGDGVIPDEMQLYQWIKAAFQNFFNNVQKDIEVQARGVRAYRELLVCILSEIENQRRALQTGAEVPDTMLTRLLKIQMGLSPTTIDRCDFDPNRVTDLRIAENVMGTVVGAIAGQEEATCRVIDSMIRLKEREYGLNEGQVAGSDLRYGSFDEARSLAINVLENRDVANSRSELRKYMYEALRLQPQGEVLLRECIKEGATIAGSRPIRAGTLIFAAHGSAMQDIENPSSFILGRDQKYYLQYGHGRHKCLGQYVSPVIMVEAMISILALENVRRPDPRADEKAFPLERRFGRLQLDNNNLYATTFSLCFDDVGTTRQYFA